MRRGEICLAHFPFTDASAAKVRPVLIISADQFNGGEDIVVLPLSSSPDPSDPHSVLIDRASPYFSLSGLRFPSAIKWTKPMTIAKSVVSRRLGRLHANLLDQVTKNLITVIS
jgi:mRNA interferase MazF